MNTPTTLTALADLLGEDRIITQPQTLEAYGSDCSQTGPSDPLALVFPESTEEVQQLVQLANQRSFALVPSGGRSGLSGGASAKKQEVIVSLEKMQQILAFDEFDQLVRCQAGVITDSLQQFAGSKGLRFPLDLSSSASSQLGGNVATNAGGNRVLHFGMTRNLVRGLVVVTGEGEKLELDNNLLKDNTGPDLKQLFIGSEGTLGIICEVSLQLIKPAEINTALVAFNELAEAFDFFSSCRQQGIIFHSYEFFTDDCVDSVITGSNTFPLQQHHPCYTLMEFEVHPEVESILQQTMNAGNVVDGVIAHSEKQARNLWRYRENISSAIASQQPIKNDVSVLPSRFTDFYHNLEQLLETLPDWSPVLFGHLGDGNLHVNLLPNNQHSNTTDVRQAITQQLTDLIIQYNGSMSAEHGIGTTKKGLLQQTLSAAEIKYMKKLKQVFDPNNILNPGKIYPE